jgi:hypothetical protein
MAQLNRGLTEQGLRFDTDTNGKITLASALDANGNIVRVNGEPQWQTKKHLHSQKFGV